MLQNLLRDRARIVGYSESILVIVFFYKLRSSIGPTWPWLIDSQPASTTKELGHLHLYCPSNQLCHYYQPGILTVKVAPFGFRPRWIAVTL